MLASVVWTDEYPRTRTHALDEHPIADDTFFTVSLDEGKTHIPFSDAESYRAALGDIRQHRLVTIYRREFDGEYGVSLSRMVAVDALLPWRKVISRILVERNWTYMNGDCWHFALAAHRISGSRMVAARFDDYYGTTQVDHVGLSLPDGTFLDARGIHDDLESFTTMTPVRTRTVTPIDETEIHEILETYCDYDPTCESALQFDRETEALVRLAFGHLLEPGPEATLAP